MTPQFIKAQTWHKRLGGPENSFRYDVDYVLVDADQEDSGPFLFSLNRANVFALHDRDHGGLRDQGHGVSWVRQVLSAHQLRLPSGSRIMLLAQPRIFGTKFTPVSFWLVVDQAEQLIAVIAEVNNTFGDRHSYLCHKPGLAPITADDELVAEKIFHVSPFQPVDGEYRFRFDMRNDRVAIRIDYRHAEGGLLATLAGDRTPLTSAAIASAALRRPLGALRVSALIHYQAVKLWWQRARFRSRPEPPSQEVSRMKRLSPSINS